MVLAAVVSAQTAYRTELMQREHWSRGVVAVRAGADTVAVGWRFLEEDPADVAFHVFRNGRRLTRKPIRDVTFFYDVHPLAGEAHYEVRPVVTNASATPVAGSWTLPADAPTGYVALPLEPPEPDTMPDGTRCAYSANDAAVADLDGDGEPEVVLMWMPDNAKDNAQSGFTGRVYLDAYTLRGRRMWRINLGRNIRAGAHYSPFLVYDFDGDGRAELTLKTADGTIDGTGRILGDASADYRVGVSLPAAEGRHRSRQGYVAAGPEFLTVFDGLEGAALCSVPYTPPRGDVRAWGDDYANRSERYLAAVAFLDGRRPHIVMCRGYYTRTVLAAYLWDGCALELRWTFDTDRPEWSAYAGQGNHNLRVGDVDGDGCDEITYGSCCIDHDGTGLYNTGMGHGDALHLTAFGPADDRLQVWDCHENRRDGSDFREAATGRVIFRLPSDRDVGRCMAADIDPCNPGMEMWSTASGGLRNVRGEVVNACPEGLPVNMAVWWDGDLLRELLDRAVVTKYNPETGRCDTLQTFPGCCFNNGTKSTPCLQGDILGDWREEVLVRTADSRELRLYVSTLPTPYRFHTFLQEPVYRHSLTMQNVGYNQPTQPGFFFGADLEGSGRTVRGHRFGTAVSTHPYLINTE